MDQQKVGSFLKALRKEKNITQEQLAEILNVSGRTVSRWETGRNIPDITLLVDIANFYDVDVREIIEGKRRSEMLDKETSELVTDMADYATKEKSVLLRRMQITSFIGVLVLVLSIVLQTVNVSPENINKLALFASVVALIIMSGITLYVTGLLEKMVKSKKLMLGIKIATMAGLAIALWRIVVIGFLAGVLILESFTSPIEEYNDVSKYEEYMTFSSHANEEGTENQWMKWGMDETIWPEKITDSMKVEDFKMVYYNPWDAQYLGYMVVDYTPEEYEKEVKRLQEYNSTDYIGYYCVKEETTYDLLAVNADSYQGFVYALTDGKSRIIYAEQIFCNYFMDLDYTKYIPQEYLLDGFDATKKSSYYKKMTK